jgi:hypothetical protein
MNGPLLRAHRPAERPTRRAFLSFSPGWDDAPAGPARWDRRHGDKNMVTRDQPGLGWTVVLRRQPVRIVDGHPEGGYNDAFKIVCCDCGDHPDLDYSEVPPELRQVRGPYSVADGIAAYVAHVGCYHQPAPAGGRETAAAGGRQTVPAGGREMAQAIGMETAPAVGMEPASAVIMERARMPADLR